MRLVTLSCQDGTVRRVLKGTTPGLTPDLQGYD